MDEGLNRMRKGGVNSSPPDDVVVPPAPPSQRLPASHEMKPGTYWSDRLGRYVDRDDPDWSQEGYKAVVGEDWLQPAYHISNRVGPADLHPLFTYHPPQEGQSERYEKLRDGAKTFAYLIMECCPGCADRSVAIRKVREAVFVANASIALETVDDS